MIAIDFEGVQREYTIFTNAQDLRVARGQRVNRAAVNGLLPIGRFAIAAGAPNRQITLECSGQQAIVAIKGQRGCSVVQRCTEASIELG